MLTSKSHIKNWIAVKVEPANFFCEKVWVKEKNWIDTNQTNLVSKKNIESTELKYEKRQPKNRKDVGSNSLKGKEMGKLVKTRNGY